jgi:hypothetical protein
MEEFFAAMLAGVVEILVEVFFWVAFEAILGLLVRSARNVFSPSNAIDPITAAFIYLFLGIGSGVVSVFLFPRHLIHPSSIHGMSLVLSPVITGLVMSQVGALLRRSGKRVVRIESFTYGFAFAFGLALIRFVYLK